jgi:hypothetical protein
MPNEQDFRAHIRGMIREAQAASAAFVDINSGHVHRAVSGYPAPDGNHRMPICCQVMKDEKRSDDVVLSSPLKGQGASLTIRYKLPRT